MEGRFVLWKMGDAGVCECGCRSLVDSVEVVSDGGGVVGGAALGVLCVWSGAG